MRSQTFWAWERTINQERVCPSLGDLRALLAVGAGARSAPLVLGLDPLAVRAIALVVVDLPVFRRNGVVGCHLHGTDLSATAAVPPATPQGHMPPMASWTGAAGVRTRISSVVVATPRALPNRLGPCRAPESSQLWRNGVNPSYHNKMWYLSTILPLDVDGLLVHLFVCQVHPNRMATDSGTNFLTDVLTSPHDTSVATPGESSSRLTSWPASKSRRGLPNARSVVRAGFLFLT